MNIAREVFLAMPDTVVITDDYLYVIDFNHREPFEGLRKGARLTRYMPDMELLASGAQDEIAFGERIYQRRVEHVRERGVRMGCVVTLADITEKRRLIEQTREKNAELDELTRRQALANAELAEFARQAETMSAYSEQLRLARSIHDDAGHAITALHAISQMCLVLRGSDGAKFRDLVDSGIAICEKSGKGGRPQEAGSLRELLSGFQDGRPFRVEIAVHGEEPDFAAPLYPVIASALEEAYHNTLAHSLADTLTVRLEMKEDRMTLRAKDNGRFRGAFEKGFGLAAMEENALASGGSVAFLARDGDGFGVVLEWEREQVRKWEK